MLTLVPIVPVNPSVRMLPKSFIHSFFPFFWVKFLLQVPMGRPGLLIPVVVGIRLISIRLLDLLEDSNASLLWDSKPLLVLFPLLCAHIGGGAPSTRPVPRRL